MEIRRCIGTNEFSRRSIICKRCVWVIKCKKIRENRWEEKKEAISNIGK